MTRTQTDFRLDGFLPYRMAVVAEKLSNGMSRRYRDEFGISVADWRVLVHVADAGRVSIREIHQRVHLEKSSASRAASRMEAAGYLTKAVNSDDRRLVALELTAAGQALMGQLEDRARDYQARLDALLGEDMPALERVLAALMEEDL